MCLSVKPDRRRHVQRSAESLPFEYQPFAAAMALSTIDRWPDAIAELLEMRRGTRRVLVLTYDSRQYLHFCS
jgi:hypothetical protein